MLNATSLSTLGFMLLLVVAPYISEPAYNVYLLAFMLLLASRLPQSFKLFTLPVKFSPFGVIVGGWFIVSLLVTALSGNGARDILRDIGIFLSFIIGRHVFISIYRKQPLKLLETLSVAGIIVSLAALVGAVLAYRAGASAYYWRGTYVPPSHNWLPFFLAINVALAQMQPGRRHAFVARALFCVMGTLASLSRTDILLELLFGLFLVVKYRRTLWKSGQSIVLTIVLVFSSLPLLAWFSSLSVVQERLEVGISEEDDMSLGWRFIENTALLNHFSESGLRQVVTGFGWGARMPLPPGILDFNDNDSIPHLHNSLLTIALKFGVVGLAIFLVYIAKIFRRWLKCQPHELQPMAYAGGWIMIFSLGKAMTLQGLTEWAQVMFFGMACAFIVMANDRNRRLPHQGTTRILGHMPT